MILEAKRENGAIHFRAPVAALDKFNGNKRRYPTAVMEKALARIANSQGTMFGSAGHVDRLEAPEVSHIVDKLWIDKLAGTLMAEGRILPTTRGKDLEIAVRAGKLGLSLKGTGTTLTVEEDKTEVQDDYKLLGVDFVLNPSFDIARVSKKNLFESLEFEEITSEDAAHINEVQELCAKINEAVDAGLKKVDGKIRKLVEAELGKRQIPSVELVENVIKEVEAQVRFVLVEAERSKLIKMVETVGELGIASASDTEPPVNESLVNQIFKENKISGTPKTRQEIIASLRKK